MISGNDHLPDILAIALYDLVADIHVIGRGAFLPGGFKGRGGESAFEVIGQDRIAVSGQIHVGKGLARSRRQFGRYFISVQLRDARDIDVVDNPLRPFGNSDCDTYIVFLALEVIFHRGCNLDIPETVGFVEIFNIGLILTAKSLAVSAMAQVEGRRSNEHAFPNCAGAEVLIADNSDMGNFMPDPFRDY